MSTPQSHYFAGDLVSYEALQEFVYQCHRNVALQYDQWYYTDYANGDGADNRPQQSNGLKDKIRVLTKIVSSHSSTVAIADSDLRYTITVPALPYRVTSSGTLEKIDGSVYAYDNIEIIVQTNTDSLHSDYKLSKGVCITANDVAHVLKFFYDSKAAQKYDQELYAHDLHWDVIEGMSRMNDIILSSSNCDSCIVSCNVSCGQGCAYNCGRSWACSNCRGSCRSCSGITGCGTCGGGCTYHCGGGCAYNCSGQCNTCTGGCTNMCMQNSAK